MHKINTNNKNLQTDLIIETNPEITAVKKSTKDEVTVYEKKIDNYNYTTIEFTDITDNTSFTKVQNTFIKQLKKYLKEDFNSYLIVGLGNNKSTPDSLGPETLKNILVTAHLFLIGEVESTYKKTAILEPNVTGITGLETSEVIKSIIKNTDIDCVILVDSLKASHINRLNKIIQITNRGINPGSGINNNRKEISKKTLNKEIIAIGVPTVVGIKTIIENLLHKKVTLNEDLIVTPTNIDFQIEKLALLIGNGINKALHHNYKRQNNN